MNRSASAAVPAAETARLAALRRYELLDTTSEPTYDGITALAAHICETPIAMISLVDESRQWFKSKIGIEANETPRAVAFCAHAIRQPESLLLVPDAQQDARFSDNALVTGPPYLRFYAGVPIVTPDNFALGTLCVLDNVPRTLSLAQQEALATLARQVEALIELRSHNLALARHTTQSWHMQSTSQLLVQQMSGIKDKSQCDECGFNAGGSCAVQDFYNKAPCGYHSLDKNGCYVLVNDTELEWLGYSREELLGKSFTEVLPLEDRDAFIQKFKRGPLRGFPLTQSLEVQRKDGSTFPALLNASVVLDAKGELQVTRSSLTNITETKAVIAALRESEERFKAFMEDGPVIAFIKDGEGRYSYANQLMHRLFKKQPNEIIGRCDAELWPPATYQHLKENDRLVLEGDRILTAEETVPDANGQPTHWISYKFPLTSTRGQRLLGGMAIDITQRKLYEKQLKEYQSQLEDAVARLEMIATTDALTQLKNRGEFMTRLEEEFARALRYKHPLSLLILDADNFKKYNDEFGHPAGDKVLQAIATCLRECARPSDLAARYGGEEFAMILSNTDQNGALALAERVRQTVSALDTLLRPVTISIGVASRGQNITDFEQLIAAADAALYEAKRSGKNCVRHAA